MVLPRGTATLAVMRLGLTAFTAVLIPTAVAAQGTPSGCDPGADHVYQFRETQSRELDVTVNVSGGEAEFVWPRMPQADWDTALLSLRLLPQAPAEDGEWVQIRSGPPSAAQFLESGARGLRWMNLSFLKGQVVPGARVQVVPHGARVVPGPAKLRLFSNHLDLRRPMLVVAPHPDDAEVAAFGLYADRMASVVTITAGNGGGFKYRRQFPDPARHYRFKGRLRVIDSVTVPWQGSVPPERCFNLGYFDGRLDEMYRHPDRPVSELFSPNRDTYVYRRYNLGRMLPLVPRTATWQHLVEDLVELLRRADPALIVIPHPWLDSHRDHQFVAVAMAQALRQWQKPVTFLLYVVHACGDQYPFGPPGSVLSVPPWSDGQLPFDRVYSHPLTGELQTRKLFALESMHDLRLSPARQQRIEGADPAARPPDPDPGSRDDHFFRRGVRANELFFVYDRESIESVIRVFLAKAPSNPD